MVRTNKLTPGKGADKERHIVVAAQQLFEVGLVHHSQETHQKTTEDEDQANCHKVEIGCKRFIFLEKPFFIVTGCERIDVPERILYSLLT